MSRGRFEIDQTKGHCPTPANVRRELKGGLIKAMDHKSSRLEVELFHGLKYFSMLLQQLFEVEVFHVQVEVLHMRKFFHSLLCFGIGVQQDMTHFFFYLLVAGSLRSTGVTPHPDERGI